jgi:hypothetical protein
MPIFRPDVVRMPLLLMHFSTLSIGLAALFALSLHQCDSPPQLKDYRLQRVLPGRAQASILYKLEVELENGLYRQPLFVKLSSGEASPMKQESESRYGARIAEHINLKEGLKLYFEGTRDTLFISPPLRLTTEIRN